MMKCQLQNKPSANPVIRPFPVTSVCVMRAAEKVRPPSLSVPPPHTHGRALNTSSDFSFVSPSAAMYDEIRQFREACGPAHMKTILAVGELGSFTNVYRASMVAMMAGQSHSCVCVCVSSSDSLITLSSEADHKIKTAWFQLYICFLLVISV